MYKDALLGAIQKELSNLEESGDVVLCASTPDAPAKRIYRAVIDFVPNEELSLEELVGLRSLVLHAVDDKRFFDWEMPTLTGFKAEDFRRIAEKLPKG